ncbi:MAG: DUF5662 family protein [Candidatus Izemoplasmatales bacterium]|nr:DUF5662 family protein [Candidatus Izemoplasmatales bacterium]
MATSRELELQAVRKRDEYRIYINNHIKNVQFVWRNLHAIDKLKSVLTEIHKFTLDEVMNILNTTSSQVMEHDSSKFSKAEFESYRKNFFPIDDAEKEDNVQNFEKAWDHHKNHNMHHWDWWADNGHRETMPISFVLEMCADWIAMSMHFYQEHDNKENAIEWYEKNKHKIKLGKKQEETVIKVLALYYEYYNTDGSTRKL